MYDKRVSVSIYCVLAIDLSGLLCIKKEGVSKRGILYFVPQKT